MSNIGHFRAFFAAPHSLKPHLNRRQNIAGADCVAIFRARQRAIGRIAVMAEKVARIERKNASVAAFHYLEVVVDRKIAPVCL